MTKKYLVYINVSLIMLISSYAQGQSLVLLKQLKSSIDVKLNSPKSNPLVLVKTSHNKLVEVKNQNWPDSIVMTYNILKNASGKVIAFSEEPSIESSDDSFNKTYYFDDKGETFAIELFHGRADNDGEGATGGTIRGTETMYFDENFHIISKSERFTDGKGHPLKKINDYDFCLDSNFYSNKDLCLNQFKSLQKVSYESTLPSIQDFFLPNVKFNKVQYTYGNDRSSDLTGLTYIQKKDIGYDITSAHFFQGRTTSIETRTIIIKNNQVLQIKNVLTNALGITNQHKQFTIPLVVLKMPSKGNAATWTYISPEGDKYTCNAFLLPHTKKEGDNAIDESVIKVVMIMPLHPQFKTIDYYQKGYGLTKEELVTKDGIHQVFIASEFSFDQSAASSQVQQINNNNTIDGESPKASPDDIKTASDADPNQIFTAVEREPRFDGFSDFLSKNIMYPAAAKTNSVQGKVIIQFVVETDGSLSNMRILRTPDESLAQEALRVLKLCPKWSPGYQNGRPVRVFYTIPISFSIADEHSK